MEVEAWQVIYIIGVFIGLLIGWCFHPYFGAAFIWIFIIAVETFHAKREKSFERRSDKKI